MEAACGVGETQTPHAVSALRLQTNHATANSLVARFQESASTFPHMSEKVLVAGRHDVFLVLSVDHDKQTTDLMQLNHVSWMLDSAPFSSLRQFREQIPLDSA